MIKTFCDICGGRIKDTDKAISICITTPVKRKYKFVDYELTQPNYEYETKTICENCAPIFMNVFRKEEE